MMKKHYRAFYDRIVAELEEEGLDGLFNIDFRAEVLYAGTILLYVSGDKVKKL